MLENIINDVDNSTIEYNIDYKTKSYGLFKVISKENLYKGNQYYKIRFNLTGYEKNVVLDSIRKGSIKDPYFPSIFGVACCGISNMACDSNGINTKEYTLWHGMIARCYNPNCPEFKYYGGIGVRVCDKWLCFEYFLQDLPLIEGYDLWKNSTGRKYDLEKDYKQINSNTCKIYSLDTCYFSTQYSNKMIKSLTNSNKYSSKYIGVNRIEYPNGLITYESYIWVNSKKISLGFYSSEEAAAQARDSAALQYYDSDAILNNIPPISIEEMKMLCTSRKNKSQYFGKPLYRLINKEQHTNEANN